jgi:hypothetical protein
VKEFKLINEESFKNKSLEKSSTYKEKVINENIRFIKSLEN